MKFFSRRITVRTADHADLVNITETVREIVKMSGVRDGSVNVFITHTTAPLTINENEPGLEKDILEFMTRLVPEEGNYMHHHFFRADGRMAVNAWAHIRASLLGGSLTIPVEEGKMVLSRRQNIYLVEFDGPKERNLFVQVQGEE